MHSVEIIEQMRPSVPKVISSKSFNHKSRELLSKSCPVSECDNSQPTDGYVLQKVNSAYVNLVSRWEEFKPFIEAISKGKSVWQREFSVGQHAYKTITLDDILVSRQFNDESNTKQGFCQIPLGYAAVLAKEDAAELRFEEVYKALGYGDKHLPILDADIKDGEKHFEEFKLKKSSQRFIISWSRIMALPMQCRE
ncbi:MAG: hypothetical protein NTY99_01645 [DPANN group archaeon]|nr:hypothetical protein [DPANN group archaeon]